MNEEYLKIRGQTVLIEANVSDLIEEKLKSLAARRYGDKSQVSMDRVLTDIVMWKLVSWDRYGLSWRDYLWIKLAYFHYMPWLRRIGWGKIIESYFKD